MISHGLSMLYQAFAGFNSFALVSITGKKDIMMNYRNYETSIIRAWGVRLIGWPSGITFVSPSHLGMVLELQKIHDALKSKSCGWEVLSASELQGHETNLQAHQAVGEVVKVLQKRRSDFGVHKGKRVSTAERPAKRTRRTAPKSAEHMGSGDDE